MAKPLTCPKCGEDDIETVGWELWHKHIMVDEDDRIVSVETAGSADTIGGLINDRDNNLHCIACDHGFSLEFATDADDVLIRASAEALGYEVREVADEFGNYPSDRYTVDVVPGKLFEFRILDGGAPVADDEKWDDYNNVRDHCDFLNAND